MLLRRLIGSLNQIRRILIVAGIILYSVLRLQNVNSQSIQVVDATTAPPLQFCLNREVLSCMHNKINLIAKPQIAKVDHKADIKQQLPACFLTIPSAVNYRTETSKATSKLNNQADQIRSLAANNNESYQEFEDQMNALFTTYDIQVQDYYKQYLDNNKNCRPDQPQPTLFQMFP
jgi:hypothetical protein